MIIQSRNVAWFTNIQVDRLYIVIKVLSSQIYLNLEAVSIICVHQRTVQKISFLRSGNKFAVVMYDKEARLAWFVEDTYFINGNDVTGLIWKPMQYSKLLNNLVSFDEGNVQQLCCIVLIVSC